MSIRQRKGYGPDQVIDLDLYKNKWSEEEIKSHVKRGEFITYRYLDLAKYGGDPFTEELLNIAIRHDCNADNADRGIAQSYKKKGWKYDPFPPIIDTKENVKDGRTRIRGAIINGEQFIPVAVFEYPEESEYPEYVQQLSEGLIGNDDLITRPTKSKDLYTAAVAAVTKGHVPHNKTEITKLLTNEFEADRFVDTLDIPEIASQVYESVHKGEEAIWTTSRADILDYIKRSPDVPDDACFENEVCLGGKKIFTYAAPSNTNQGRLWAKISECCPEECYVVLYTTERVPSKIKQQYDEFMEKIDKRYEECFEIVNRTASKSGFPINISCPPEKPWKLLGVIPQKNDETHQTYRKLHKLIPLEDYC